MTTGGKGVYGPQLSEGFGHLVAARVGDVLVQQLVELVLQPAVEAADVSVHPRVFSRRFP